MEPKISTRPALAAGLALAIALTLALPATPAGAAGVTFHEAAPTVGVDDYQRTRSVRDEQYSIFLGGPTGNADLFCKQTVNTLLQDAGLLPPGGDAFVPPLPMPALVCAPQKSRGAPGVCAFDHDGDGDQDLYVTNGPGSPNSLYSNQLVETGTLSFVDVAASAGVTATAQDSSGCAAGDLDNDGDKELLVLGMGPGNVNLLYENLGGGTFAPVNDPVVAGSGRQATSATLVDVDLDGLLDLYIGHTFDFRHSLPIFVVPTALNQHDRLLHNDGGLSFTDVSASSGIEDLAGMITCPPTDLHCDPADAAPIPGQPAGITWAVTALDVDLDGDLDIVSAEDQAAIPPVGAAFSNGIPGTPDATRGLIHLFLNDGTGHFTDAPAAGPGSWMGVASCDLDHDGALDLWGSNFGDVPFSFAFNTPLLGAQTSRWYLGDGNGNFTDPRIPGVGLPGVTSTPFGWGASTVDYDNDGDCDIAYVGNLNAGPFITLDNPVALLENDGSGGFSRDYAALSAAETDRQRLRVKHGSAAADLDNDGFPEIVSVAGFNVPPSSLQPGPGGQPPLTFPNPFDFGGPWDSAALISTVFAPAPSDPSKFVLVPAFRSFPNGDLSVLRNSGNGNGWVKVDTAGTVGIAPGGAVNRDGVGAVVRVTPEGGQPALAPVTAGDSYSSQNSEILGFGLGDARRAVVEVLWPGGVRNRLYGARSGETLLFPEIPCSIDGDLAPPAYAACVNDALEAIVDAGLLSAGEAGRFRASALRAHAEEH